MFPSAPPRELRERLDGEGETLPLSFELGRETEVGPSSLYGFDRERFELPLALPWDRERERDLEGAIAGGGKGGGSVGKIGRISPPGT